MSSHYTFRVARYVAACAVTALSLSVTAHAGDTAETPLDSRVHETVISYSDLDLSRDTDVHTLYTRLQRASDQVCGQYRDSRDLRTKQLYKMCFQDTLARAVDSVDNAAVTAMFAADDRVRVASRYFKAPTST